MMVTGGGGSRGGGSCGNGRKSPSDAATCQVGFIIDMQRALVLLTEEDSQMAIFGQASSLHAHICHTTTTWFGHTNIEEHLSFEKSDRSP